MDDENQAARPTAEDIERMMNLQDWFSALDAIDSRDAHDTEPLAALLRSNKPIPTQVRNMLADMLSPLSGADYIDTTLVPKPSRSDAKYTSWGRRRRAYLAYAGERDKGCWEAEALETARKVWDFGEDKSNFHTFCRSERKSGIAWRDWMTRCGWKWK